MSKRRSTARSNGPNIAVFTVKKFAFVNGGYWTYGGFGDYVHSLLPHFSRVVLACHPREMSAPPVGWYRLEAPNLRFAWLPYYERENQCLRALPRMLWQSRALVEQADIVNARVPDYTGLCGAFWARRLGKPLFFNVVDDWHGYARDLPTRLRGLMRFGLRLHLRLYCKLEEMYCREGLVFAQGHSVADFYRTNPECRPLVSSSHSEGDVLAGRREIPQGSTCRLTAIGRHVYVKGHRDLIHALGLLREDPTLRFELTIAGDGPDAGEYRRLASELGVNDRLHLAGQLGRREVFELLDRTDIFCLPSRSEGTPKVLLEAMARGTPVVATNVGGVATVVRNEETGLLIEPGHPILLARAIRRVAGDKELWHRLSANGTAEARKHTVEKEWGAMMGVVRQTYPEIWSFRQESRPCSISFK